MKKILALLATATLSTSSSFSVVSCINKNETIGTRGFYDSSSKSSIMNQLIVQMQNSLSKNLQEIAILDVGTHNMEESFAPFFTSVSKTTKISEKSANDNILTVGIDFIRDSIWVIFDNINQQIKRKYQNNFPGADNFPFKLDLTTFKYVLKYIDVDELVNKDTPAMPAELKTVRVDVEFSFTSAYINQNQESSLSTSIVLTNNENFMKNVLTSNTLSVAKVLNDFFQNYSSIVIDTTEGFEEIYTDFSLNVLPVSMISDILKEKLQDYISNNSIQGDKTNLLAINETHNPILNQLFRAINLETSGKLFATTDLNISHPSNWAKQDISLNDETVKSFIEMYRPILNVFKSENNRYKIGDFQLNLNAFDLYGAPLLTSVINNGNAIRINIEISQTGLDKKLKNFASLFISFHDFYKANIQNPYDDNPYTKLTVSKDVFAQLNNKDMNEIFEILLNNFKNSLEVRSLEDLDLFNIINLGKNATVKQTGTNYKMGLFGNEWALSFTFGINPKNSIHYIPYGAVSTEQTKNFLVDWRCYLEITS